MPDALITSFFQKQNKPAATSKKRPPSRSSQYEDPDWTPSNASKRSKVAGNKGKSSKSARRSRAPDSDVTLVDPFLHLETPGASTSKSKTTAAKRKVIAVASNDPDVTMVGNTPDKGDLFSRYRSPLPPSSAPSSSHRHGRRAQPREESIVPATPQHEQLFSSPKDIVTPIRLNLKPLSQTWSDETIDSSQSQEDVDLEEYGGASINLTRVLFNSPRGDWVIKRSVDFEEEDEVGAKASAEKASFQVVGSSQSQSQYLAHASPQRLRARATILIEDHLELIPSSQSQEKELDLHTVLSQRSGWRHNSRSAILELPHPPHLKKSSSLSKELPVRKLSLCEDDDSGPLADDLPELPLLTLNEDCLTPKRPRQETQALDTPSQRQVASSLLEYDYHQADESCPMASPSRSIRFGSSQGFSYSQSSVMSQPSPSRRLFPLTHNLPSTPSKAAALFGDDSQTQEMTPPSAPHLTPSSNRILTSTPSKVAALLDDSRTQEMTPPSARHSIASPNMYLPSTPSKTTAFLDDSQTQEMTPASVRCGTPSKAAAPLDDSQTQEMTPASAHYPTPSRAVTLLEDSQTQEMTPVSVIRRSPNINSPQSLPPEVKEFHAMFEGGGEDESYPPDFPMSLRI